MRHDKGIRCWLKQSSSEPGPSTQYVCGEADTPTPGAAPAVLISELHKPATTDRCTVYVQDVQIACSDAKQATASKNYTFPLHFCGHILRCCSHATYADSHLVGAVRPKPRNPSSSLQTYWYLVEETYKEILRLREES